MRLSTITEAMIVGATTVAVALVAAPVGSATPLQLVVLLAVAVAAFALVSHHRAVGTIGAHDPAADVVRIAALHAAPAIVAPLSVSLRLRC